MTALELLNDLRQQDIHLQCAGDKLRVNAPKGAVTPELRTALLEQKAALLALLSEQALPSDEPDQGQPGQVSMEAEIATVCCVCGAEVEQYSEQGVAYCAHHWTEHMQPQKVPTPQHNPPAACRVPLTSVQEIIALAAQWGETSPTPLVLDLETTGLDPRTNKVITLALGRPGKVMIIDLRGYYSAGPALQQKWRDALRRLLHREETLWIGHHIKFDWSYLAQQFGVKLKSLYDTMLVERLLYAGRPVSASLLNSAQRYGIGVTKEQQSWFVDLDRRPAAWAAPLPEEQLVYIRQDIEVPYQIYERQQEAIARQELARVVAVEHQALPAIAAMEVHGVCVDVQRWRVLLATRHEQKVALEQQLKQVLGQALAHTQPAQETLFGEENLPAVNLRSSEHLVQALHRLGVHVASASKEALQEVIHQHQIVPRLLK